MITFIYPKDDWTAAEIVVKMQALAASQNIKVYSPPKNTRRDEQEIAMKLAKTKYSIFLAYDVHAIDEYTTWELKFLSERKTEIYSVVPDDLVDELIKLGIGANIYPYKYGERTELITSVKKIIDEIKTKEDKKGDSDLGELLTFLLLLGMILFLLGLILSKRD